MVREAKAEGLTEILELYLCLHEETIPEQCQNIWQIRRSTLETGLYILLFYLYWTTKSWSYPYY